jgi:hypothetical protein
MRSSEDFFISAGYDGVVRNVTIAIWILLVTESVFFIYLFSVVMYLSSLGIIFAIFIPCISLIVLLVPYLFKPKGFRLTSEDLTIERLLNTISIPYDQISTIQRGKWTWKAVRLGGSGGLYGYLGLFHLFGIGRVWMYTTNRHKMILIETKQGKKYGLSPENPEDFESQLQKKTMK